MKFEILLLDSNYQSQKCEAFLKRVPGFDPYYSALYLDQRIGECELKKHAIKKGASHNNWVIKIESACDHSSKV